MAYSKQNFEDGQVLEAEHLVAMEDGILGAYVKARTVTLYASAWTGTNMVYSQDVAVGNTGDVTTNTKVDLYPSPDQLSELIDYGISLTAVNNNGIITVKAVGDKPPSDYVMQVLLTEVMSE